ncbi:sigma-70 family RNA polymerase sigma factor [Nonomuraea ferruginea]|uniref:Sigma-70 family RNA polymerase sigma factor n=1 Tax=Nonomuraea ferruginea TaxID=46174 RepID=A0ABT4TBK9_9ACTN|nr:sigma-70 family RNA polymerase sigma factor [Nonomuraea ferruginea]MDA0646897.1 sigma-70 family RNA polymerase sigma factor [Nonomuraea ferruginea]
MEDSQREDAALTKLVRAGDSRAVAELYERHHAAVLAFARRLCQDPHIAEDLASEAFTRTLRTVRGGEAGPSGAWRPYLYAVARNTAAEWARTDQRRVLTPEFRDDELTVAEPEPPDDLVTRAYRSLPPRWQTVLWHTVIEDERPEQVAEILGTTPGNVGVLAFRAREGLRKAYLAAHVAGASGDCRKYADPLAAAVRKKSGRLPRALRAHLDSCPSCARAHSRLLDLNATLRAALPIALLPFAVEGLGKAAASKSTSMGMLGWAIPATAATVITAAIVFTLPPEPAPPPAAAPPTSSTPTPTRSPSGSPSASPSGSPSPSRSPSPSSSLSPSPSPSPSKTRKPTPAAVAGTRISYAGRCVGTKGTQVAALSCTDPGTAWRVKGDASRFQLVNAVTGRCLTAGAKYDTVSFNGGGIRTVQLTPCSAAPAQRWNRPTFSDGVPRLVNVSTGMALSIGKEFGGKRPPTAFILYGAYTDSADQRITLV